jgi:(2Fe-2S) ferredoxin
VLVTRTGCLYPCSFGPVLVVYPDRVWYTVPDRGALELIVEQHLLGGKVAEQYARQPEAV